MAILQQRFPKLVPSNASFFSSIDAAVSITFLSTSTSTFTSFTNFGMLATSVLVCAIVICSLKARHNVILCWFCWLSMILTDIERDSMISATVIKHLSKACRPVLCTICTRKQRKTCFFSRWFTKHGFILWCCLARRCRKCRVHGLKRLWQ